MKESKGYAISCIGASHIKSGKECQDRSKIIKGKKVSGVVVCDGHGGDKHFRSAVGAETAIHVFEHAIFEFAEKYPYLLKRNRTETALKNLEKHLIFSWREAVEDHVNKNPFSPAELEKFDDYTVETLKANPHIAYGSTFLSCFVMKNELFVIQLGDGEIRIITADGQVISPIPEDENLMFGMTTSLCNDAAIQYVRDCKIKIGDIAAFVLCTDGVKNSFDTNEHYNDFCKTVFMAFEHVSEESFGKDIEKFLSELTQSGSGDDVSVGILLL